MLRIFLLWKPARKLFSRVLSTKTEETLPEPEQAIPAAGFFAEAREHIAIHGGPVIFAHMLARLVGCLALLGLTITTLILDERNKSEADEIGVTGKWGKKPKNKRGRSPAFSTDEWLQVAMCITYVHIFSFFDLSCVHLCLTTAICLPSRSYVGLRKT